MLRKISSSWRISGAAIKSEAFKSIGGFDVRMPQYGDTDFYIRGLLMGFRDVYIANSLTKYRIIDGSVTDVSFKTNRDVREILYLVDKFKVLLDIKSRRVIKVKAKTILIKRFLRSLFKCDMRSAKKNLLDLFQIREGHFYGK
jgi:GT2 family glycosyltransferase